MSGEFGLEEPFNRINAQHFDGFLDLPVLKWNSRLRSSAGRFVPGRRGRRFGIITYEAVPPVIEVAAYLKKLAQAQQLIEDTLGHEMIHYWLWLRRRPYGHTEEFYKKMQAMGVSRYNPVPQLRPHKWLYRCGFCQKSFPTRRKLSKKLACADCCQTHSRGIFDPRFLLIFEGEVPLSQAASSPMMHK
jgi:predicted SprT family Zn-dependent metalloprotease